MKMNAQEALADLVARDPRNTYIVTEKCGHYTHANHAATTDSDVCVTAFLGASMSIHSQIVGPDLAAVVAKTIGGLK